MLVVLLQPFLSQVPDFPADNRFMMILDTDLRHLAPITSLLMGQIIGGIGFFLNQVPHILFIFQDFDDGAGFPHASMIGTISFPVQKSDNLSGSNLLHRIFLENQPNKFCPFRFNGQLAILYVVAHKRTAKYNPFFHLSGLPPDHPVGGFPAFILSHRCHDGEPQFSIAVHGVDVVGHEFHRNTDSFQFPGIAQGIYNIPGKTADFLGQNQLEFSFMGILNHPVKLDAFPGTGSGRALVRINGVQLPVGISGNVFLEILLLRFERICLILFVSRYPAITCYFQFDPSPLCGCFWVHSRCCRSRRS